MQFTDISSGVFKLSGGRKLGKNILAAFRVRKLDLDVDTDDFMLNAWLVPAFSAVNSEAEAGMIPKRRPADQVQAPATVYPSNSLPQQQSTPATVHQGSSSKLDINHLFINFSDVVLDIKCLSMDI